VIGNKIQGGGKGTTVNVKVVVPSTPYTVPLT
jgi:hypothetical protein